MTDPYAKCYKCLRWGTPGCPPGYMCFAKDNKPYFYPFPKRANIFKRIVCACKGHEWIKVRVKSLRYHKSFIQEECKRCGKIKTGW